MEKYHLYIVSGVEDWETNVKTSIKSGQLASCSFVESSKCFEEDSALQTKRLISECDLVIAIITEAFNDNTQLQYELALVSVLGKNLVVLNNGTPLSSEFDCSVLCNIDVDETSEWTEILESKIIEKLEEQSNTVNSKRDKLLQFIWNIEESLTIREKEAQKESQNKDTQCKTLFERNGGVSNTFLCSLLTTSEENISVKVNTIPPEIKELCKRHQKKITKCHIHQIGRYLELEDYHLDHVDSYFEHGTAEMFWQLVKMWHNFAPTSVSAQKLRRALKRCHINIEETHMPSRHAQVLDEMTAYFVDNMVDVNHLMPYLITENILCDVTRAYVIAPGTSGQRTMRLLEILSTKEHGMYLFVDVLRKSKNEFLAEAIIEKLPELKETVPPNPRPSTSSVSSQSSTRSYGISSLSSVFCGTLLGRTSSDQIHKLAKSRPSSTSSAPPCLGRFVNDLDIDKNSNSVYSSKECLQKCTKKKRKQHKTDSLKEKMYRKCVIQ